MNFFLRLIVTGFIAFALGSFLPGIHISGIWIGIVLALLLAFLNALLKPILVIFTLPLTLVTFGLFLFVINALIILIADYFLDGFSVDGFWWALLFSLLLSFISSLFFREAKKKD